MGMYSPHLIVNLERFLFHPEFLEDGGETGHCPEVTRLQRQGLPEVGERRPVSADVVVSRRAGMEPLRETGRMICQRRQMLYRLRPIGGLHGVFAPLQQQVHGR